MTRKQATIAVRSGLNDDEQYGCVVPPIHLSSTYNFTGFNEPRAHDYSRRGNPTRDVTQRALAELEGGAGAVLTNTGMSAIHLVTTVFLKPGDLLVAPHDCYGGSYRLFDSLAKRGCYRVLFVDQKRRTGAETGAGRETEAGSGGKSKQSIVARCRYCENLSARKGCGSDKCSG